VSLKARVRRLQADVEWMRWWGRLRQVEHRMKLLEIQRAREAAEKRRATPILREAPAPAAPRGEAVSAAVARPPPTPEPSGKASPMPPPLAAPVQPFIPDPPPEMQIRPVTWRFRTAQDYADDAGERYGRCLTEYDVLASSYYDEDYDDD
jgi:hypothetical protein